MSEKQAADRNQKSRWMDQVRSRLRLSSQGHSRQSSRALSLDPSRGKADNVSTTSGASSSTPGIRPSVDDIQLVAGANTMIPAIKLDDRVDEKSDNDQNIESDDKENTELRAATDGSQQENQSNDLETNTDAADSAQEDNMWKIAEAQLRQDKKKKNELLDVYYTILKSKVKDLDSSNTPKMLKQISAFIESEAERFQDTSKLGAFF